ncbi:MAG: HlyD family efflux transporter periplasmic adaptor subunit [Deltaproteobacteria bacterium]|jgi:HlyD family secretion protein|nr:HlyD family efflux transporter periplasmic adaptor subunit [Deltaproteobacteria bacterium]
MRAKFKRTRDLFILLFAGVLALLLWRFVLGEAPEERYAGFVVADNIYLAAPGAGTVLEVPVKPGQRVSAGQTLFRMDPAGVLARLAQARARLAQSEAQLSLQSANLQKALSNKQVSATDKERTRRDYERYLQLRDSRSGAISQQDLEHAGSAASSAARLDEAAAQDVAACAAGVEAASAQVALARAEMEEILFHLGNLSPRAPVDGHIEDVMYQAGEWAALNAPVVSLLPDGGRKIRFYLPQAALEKYRPGVEILFKTDGMAAPARARVSYVAPRPEYTPPVIYSLESRHRLVFLLEALPLEDFPLVPGQPLDVMPAAPRP